MKVSEVMTREVQTIQPDQTAQEAASFMLSSDAGSIPVTDGERLIGMITDRDIAVRGIAKGNGPDTPVRDLMSNDIVCARIDDDCDAVASRKRGAGSPTTGHRQRRAAMWNRQPGRSCPRGPFGHRRTGARRRGEARRPAPAIAQRVANSLIA